MQKFFDDLDSAYGSKLALRSALNMIFEFALKNEFIETNRIKFIELGKIKTIVDIYSLKEYREELENLEKMGQKSVDNLINNIE